MAITSAFSRSRSTTALRPPGLLPEPAFLRALGFERKRAERSRKPFVLMLIDQRSTSGERGASDLLEKAASAILPEIRETDIAGWHDENRVLGVIFAELGTADEPSVVAHLRARTTAALHSTLGPDELNRLHIAFHYFPQHRDDGGLDRPAIAPLYSDLTERDEARKVSRIVKRGIDLLGSSLTLIVLSPLLFLIAAAIKLSSPGPVLFRQERIGRCGAPFTFLKFRSMDAVNDPRRHREFVKQFIEGSIPFPPSGQNGHAAYKITDDARVTRVGRLLRRTSLDELPQLLNVLRGEMSLVGPRPATTVEFELYDIWHKRRVLEVRPGITGLWQVNGRSRLSFDDMVRLDLRYAQQWSLWLDLKILARTPRAVLSGEGAY